MTEESPNSTRTRPRRLLVALVWLLIVGSWVLIVARSIPGRDGDRGVFASMAERLAAGDVLYADSWDNKEPLFYLTLAAGRLISPHMDVVIELVWLLASALAAYAILRSRSVPRLMAALVGGALVPLVITGAVYVAGFSHLPGIAIVLGGYALLTCRRYVVAGVLLPVLAAFKVVMVPLLLAAVLVWFLLGRDRRALLRYGIGALIAAVLIAVLLALRGEFTGYVSLLISNVGYSQSPISDAYQIPIWVHVEPVMQGPAMAVLAGIALILALTRIAAPHRDAELWWTTCATLVASMLVIAASGLWPHHGQILYVPAALALILLVTSYPSVEQVGASSLVLVISAAIVLSGAPSLRATVDSVLSARARWSDLERIADPTQALLSVAPNGGSYARLGKNTDDSHAQGLRGFTHPCHQFVQYTYDLPSTLESIPACLPSVDYVIVDKGLVPEPNQPRWNTFVQRSEKALAADFACQAADWGRLCVNKRLISAASVVS